MDDFTANIRSSLLGIGRKSALRNFTERLLVDRLVMELVDCAEWY